MPKVIADPLDTSLWKQFDKTYEIGGIDETNKENHMPKENKRVPNWPTEPSETSLRNKTEKYQ